MTGPVEEEEWSYWDHPKGGKHVSAVTRVLPLPLTESLELPHVVGLSHPLHQGWMPHTTLHNSAIYWQRQNAFLWLRGVAAVLYA